MATVKRSDITLSESVVDTYMDVIKVEWVADFDGRLSTGERAVLSRTGRDSGGALKALEDAFVNEGWVIADDDS